MPTIMTHAAVPLALAVGLGTRAVPPRLLAAGVVVAILPDADVVGFRLGVSYEDALGHRGASHSLLAALCCGLAARAFTRRLGASFAVAFLFVTICAASHGLLDTLTSGGLGVALAWPASTERLFAPVRPIRVSPFGVSFLLSGRGVTVLYSELVAVWLPAFMLALALLGIRRFGKAG
jgi:inner membrane protein